MRRRAPAGAIAQGIGAGEGPEPEIAAREQARRGALHLGAASRRRERILRALVERDRAAITGMSPADAATVSARTSARWRTRTVLPERRKPPRNVHQAAHVGDDDGARTGCRDASSLRSSIAGDLAHLDREETAETAAGVRIRQRPQVDVLDGSEQCERLFAQPRPRSPWQLGW